MLLHLHIRDFAIVPLLEQDFQPGFTAISGETGAGKSILVDALGLLLGERADSQWVRHGAESAELSAEFDLCDNPPARAWLQEQSLDADGACLLRRVILAGGRSRAWINGTPVTVQQLAELGGLLVELHGQNQHVRLAGRRRQLELLDETGEHAALVDATRTAFTRWRDLRDALEAQRAATGSTPGEIDFMRSQLTELQQLALPAQELAELEQEHRLLAGASGLLEALAAADAGLESDELGVAEQLGRVLHQLDAYRELQPDIDAACRMLEEARINCREAQASLRAAGDRVDLSPERLVEVEMRLSALNALSRKHRVPMAGLPVLAGELAVRLDAAEHFESRREALEQQLAAALKVYRDAAAALSEARKAQAERLSGKVEAQMSELGMAGGRFLVQLAFDPDREPSQMGDDRAEVLVSANPGIPPGPLAKIASGGELSRISLAIKVAGTRAGTGRVQVFDEVDAGIGGETAHAVGRMLQRAAEGGQALCVTHLAQVAVRARQQLRVHKEPGKASARVDARVLSDDDRVEEIARMLDGRLSERSREHARELLEVART